MKALKVLVISFIVCFIVSLCMTSAVCAENMGTINSAETKSGSINPVGNNDSFIFEAQEDQTVVITVSELPESASGFEPEILLHNPDGIIVRSNWGGVSTDVLDYKVPQTGTYTIVIRDYWGDGTGDYNISLLLIGGTTTSQQDPDGGLICSGEQKSGDISLLSDTDAFAFNGQTGQGIALTISETSGSGIGFEPEVLLYAPDGIIEISNWGGVSTDIIDHNLLQTGTYTIVIRDYWGDGTGKYELSLTLIGGTTDCDGDGFASTVDCDDSDPAVNPGATEVCDDNKDNDCDSDIDQEDTDCSSPPICSDNDGDGYFPEGGACGEVDCDDRDPAVNPGAQEICDNKDNDCDGGVDEGDVCGATPNLAGVWSLIAQGTVTGATDKCSCSEDQPIKCGIEFNGPFSMGGDITLSQSGNSLFASGFDPNLKSFELEGTVNGNQVTFTISGYGITAGIGPATTNYSGTLTDTAITGEFNGSAQCCADEKDCDTAEWSGTFTMCPDNDSDGYCESNDCDDTDPNVNPGATEECNDNKDNDCDGEVDEGCTTCTDNDGDGYCDNDDCNDNDPAVNPGAVELCDNRDNDCDGEVDEGGICASCEIIADFNGCTSSDDIPLCVQFLDASTSTCGAIVSWEWVFGDGGTSYERDPLHCYQSKGKYTVKLTVEGANGDTDTITKSDCIKLGDCPLDADFIASPTSGCAPLTVKFTDKSSGPVTIYEWDLGDGGTSDDPNPSHTYSKPGTYTVTLTVKGAGCEDTEEKVNLIVVEDCPSNPVEQICEILFAIDGRANAKENAEVLRRFRDTMLSTTPVGALLTELYYYHAAEIIRILAKDNALRNEVGDLADEFTPRVKNILADKQVTMTQDEMHKIQEVLITIAERGTTELQATVDFVIKQMARPSFLKQYGIHVAD